jgi:hypothetical protein
MSSLKGNVNQLRKNVDRIYQDLNKQNNFPRTLFARKSIVESPSPFINATNNTGGFLEAFSCVRLVNGDSPLSSPLMVYPEDVDDDEEAIYGSVLGDSEDGGIAIVQIFGRALFRFYTEETSTSLIVGEKVYPLKNAGSMKGKVGNRISFPLEVIGNGIGRSLVSEISDVQLIEVNLMGSGGGGGSSDLNACLAATTENITFVDTPTIDGLLSTNGDYCVWLQNTISENGIWNFDNTKALGERWNKSFSFTVADVGRLITSGRGLINGQSLFLCIGENSIYPVETGAINCLGATTVNDSLSGTGVRDGSTPSVGTKWLVKNQTDSTQNGIYVVSSSTWKRIYKFNVDDGITSSAEIGVIISVASGTAHGSTCFIVNGNNSVTGLGAYYL